jgi:hypothetical protein
LIFWYWLAPASEGLKKEAERAGFEPAVRFDPHTAFPVPHLRPLGHLSEIQHFILRKIAWIGMRKMASIVAIAVREKKIPNFLGRRRLPRVLLNLPFMARSIVVAQGTPTCQIQSGNAVFLGTSLR